MVHMQNQLQLLFPVLSNKEVSELLDSENPKCPFHQSRYVGNRAAVDEILDLAHAAFQTRVRVDIRPDEEDLVLGDGKTYKSETLVCPRLCSARIALLGRASVGKTTLAKIFGKEVLGLPFCGLVPEQITSAAGLFDLLKRSYLESGIEIVPEEIRGGTEHYILPAGTLFIDEVHLLAGRVQDSLLGVTESNDGTLQIEDGVVDCRNLCIIIGTTGKGKLRTAFKTRFRHITMLPHTIVEVAKIVKINQPTWSDADCLLVAKLKPIPREAKAFAESVMACIHRRKITIHDAIHLVADREGINENGINVNALRTLKLLKDAPDGLSKGSLCAALSIEQEEFENDILPCLVFNELHPAYIAITHRHNITEAGLAYLQKLKT